MTDASDEQLADLHSEAQQLMTSGGKPSQMKGRLNRLMALRNTVSDPAQYLETLVMLNFLSRIKPARTNRSMAKLKKLRFNSDQKEAFLAFEQFLSANGNGVYFSAHGYHTRRLGDVPKEELFSDIKQLVSRISEIGYEVFANSGTLLGLVRDKAPISYDDDIDLAIVLKARSDEEAAKEFVSVLHALNDAGTKAVMLKSHVPIAKLELVCGFEVDLFPAYGVRRRYNVYPYARRNLTRFDILPLKTCPVSGLPIPARPEVVLARNYGVNWETPDSRFVFPWKRQNRKFAKLLKNLSNVEK